MRIKRAWNGEGLEPRLVQALTSRAYGKNQTINYSPALRHTHLLTFTIHTCSDYMYIIQLVDIILLLFTVRVISLHVHVFQFHPPCIHPTCIHTCLTYNTHSVWLLLISQLNLLSVHCTPQNELFQSTYIWLLQCAQSHSHDPPATCPNIH